MFKAENFDPVAWTKPFKESGAKFIVPVAEHHDGFQMYKSALSTWNSFETGPKRDVLGELGKAAREAGLVFGASSHRAEHYWFMGYGRDIPSDVDANGDITAIGYQETWWTFYPYIGLETRESSEPGPQFFGSVRVGAWR